MQNAVHRRSNQRFKWCLKKRDWLLGFNTRAAIFQLYSGNEHESDDEMKKKDGVQG